MWFFYKDLVRHSPGIFLRSLVRTDTVFDILSKVLLTVFVGVSTPVAGAVIRWWNALTGAELTLNGVPLWWSVILLGIVFLHGLFVYVKDDRDKVEGENKGLRDKLRAYENGGKPKVVARIENRGPVSVEEWAPSEIDTNDARAVVCVVPYKPYDTASAYFSDPAATIEVQDPNDDILVSVSYKVRGDGWTNPVSGAWGTDMNTFVEVLDEEGKSARHLYMHLAHVNIAEDGSWRHEAAGGEHLLGVPKGVYGLNVIDFAEVRLDFRGTNTDMYPALKNAATDKLVDLRASGRREYSDMRLTARRL